MLYWRMRWVLPVGLAVILAVCSCAKGVAGGSRDTSAVGGSRGIGAADGSPAYEPSGRSSIRLDLAISADLSSVEGSMSMRWANQDSEPVEQVRFLLYPALAGGRLDVKGCTVDGAAVALGGQARDAVRAIRLPSPLAPGASAVITFSWRTAVPRVDGGGPLARSAGFASLAWCFPVPLTAGTGSGSGKKTRHVCADGR